MKIDISIDSGWLLSGDGQKASFISKFLREANSKWQGQIGAVRSSAFDCRFDYNGSDVVAVFARDLKDLFASVAGAPFDPAIFHVTIDDRGKKYTVASDGTVRVQSGSDDLLAQINALRNSGAAESDTDHGSAPQASPSGEEDESSGESAPAPDTDREPEAGGKGTDRGESSAAGQPDEENKVSAFDAIQGLVGSGDFKKLAGDIKNIAPQIIKNRSHDIFFSEAYLFSIDMGNGYHSSLKLLGSLLSEVGLFDGAVKSDTIVIPSYNDNDMPGKMKSAVATLETALQKQRLLTIDISEWIGHTQSREFKKLAMQVFRSNRKCAVVFRIPFVKQAVIDATVKDISDVVSVRPVVFEPFSGGELREIAQRYLNANGFSFSENAWQIFDSQIDVEKADGFFYGIHTVHKLVGDIIRKKELHAATTGNENKVIADEIASSFEVPENAPAESLDTLEHMIGMQEITRKVVEIVNQIVYARKTGFGSKPTMHMCFVGNPGTGKTTVARIIGNVLKERGVLRIGKFYEHHGHDLCGEYVGHTAPKTRAICQEAYGSVLFIDEAYSLATGGDRYNYGKEAIDTLITEMENHGDDLIVIFSGYPDDIQKMIALNPGMKSRIPYTIEFPNYTRDQLTDIFMEMVRKSFACSDDLEESARKFFRSIPDEVLNDKTFGNGRYVRNIFERTWGKAIARSSENGFDGIVITSQDFTEATKECHYDDYRKSTRKIGF